MTLPTESYLLRILIGEKDKQENMPLYEWIVKRAKQEKLAGATVLRGIESFGAKSFIHTAKILQLSTDLPIIIEIIDSSEKIEGFLSVLENVIKEGLVTTEKVHVRIYRGNHTKEEE